MSRAFIHCGDTFIAHRRLTVKGPEPLDRGDAKAHASWFEALADGTRVQLVSLLARAGEPMTAGQIVVNVLCACGRHAGYGR